MVILVNFGPLAAEIGSLVWSTPANFNGFRVLASLLQRSRLTKANQTWRFAGHMNEVTLRQARLVLRRVTVSRVGLYGDGIYTSHSGQLSLAIPSWLGMRNGYWRRSRPPIWKKQRVLSDSYCRSCWHADLVKDVGCN